jgi:hypothetical protein
MMRLGSGQILLQAAVLGLGLLAPLEGSRADAISDLDQAFKEAYRLGAARTLADLRAAVPVLVNRFERLALYRPGIEAPELFSMDAGLYLQASAVAHTAAALVVRLAPFGSGRLDEERLAWLARYRSLLSAAEAEVARRGDIPEELRAAQRGMLDDVRRFAQRIHQQGSVDQALLEGMGETVRAAIRKNLEHAAASQLEQFRAQIIRWKADHPSLAWDRAAVVIIGVHQARGRNLQRQFFDRLLRDDPGREDRVVFAETMTPGATPEQAPTEEALTLLSKVMLDKGLAKVIFGDPLALQSDVLGEATEAIIANWR